LLSTDIRVHVLRYFRYGRHFCWSTCLHLLSSCSALRSVWCAPLICCTHVLSPRFCTWWCLVRFTNWSKCLGQWCLLCNPRRWRSTLWYGSRVLLKSIALILVRVLCAEASKIYDYDVQSHMTVMFKLLISIWQKNKLWGGCNLFFVHSVWFSWLSSNHGTWSWFSSIYCCLPWQPPMIEYLEIVPTYR
jgi:hypothetical protein